MSFSTITYGSRLPSCQGLSMSSLDVRRKANLSDLMQISKQGLENWRWVYIICATITIPVGMLGYFAVLGTVDWPNCWIVNGCDVAVARERLENYGYVTQGKMKFGHTKKTLLGVEFWTVVITNELFWNAGIHETTTSFLLQIKSIAYSRFSVAKIKKVGTVAPALGIGYTLFACFASDMYLGTA